MNSGVSPEYMLPSFPSATFPNHFTLVTGLYPENHGIVENVFWDPNIRERFSHRQSSISTLSKWWSGKPIWVTAEEQDVRTAVLMWPGAGVQIKGATPTFVEEFREEEENTLAAQRPQLIASYISSVDAAGHAHGQDSEQLNRTLVEVDDVPGSLLSGLDERNLTDTVKVIIVSDHGIAEAKGLIQLEDLVDVNLLHQVDGSRVLAGLWPKDTKRQLPSMSRC
jgi:predicted AlkP superfamily pyrophosphatase or phosphodiesterase